MRLECGQDGLLRRVDLLAGERPIGRAKREREEHALPAGGNVAAATKVGELLAQRAAAKGITRAAFDRNGYRYHGRVKALTEAARKAGLRI